MLTVCSQHCVRDDFRSPLLQEYGAILEEAAARPLVPASQQSQLVQQAADPVFGDMQLVENHSIGKRTFLQCLVTYNSAGMRSVLLATRLHPDRCSHVLRCLQESIISDTLSDTRLPL